MVEYKRVGEGIYELTDGVWVRLAGGTGSNSLIVDLKDLLLIVDTGISPSVGRKMRDAFSALSSHSPEWIVNTHYHGDHIFGNQVFSAPETRFVATKVTKRILDEHTVDEVNMFRVRFPTLKKELANLNVPCGDITFKEELRIQRGGREIVLLEMGHNHSPSDMVVLLPDERILFASDIFFNHVHPVMRDAKLKDWAETAEVCSRFPVDVIVPGHGEPTGRNGMSNFGDYLERVRALAVKAATRPDAAKFIATKLEEEYGDYLAAERLPDIAMRALEQRED